MNRFRPHNQPVPQAMDKLNQDITRLLSAAHNAIPVLRHNAEQGERIGQDSTAERDAVRRLNMAVQLLEFRLAGLLHSADAFDQNRG